MKKVLVLLTFAALAAAGCTPMMGGSGQSSSPANWEQYQSGYLYLTQTFDRLNMSVEEAKRLNPDKAAQIDQDIAPVLNELRLAVSEFGRYAAYSHASAPQAEARYMIARAAVSAVVSVGAKYAIGALVK